MEEPTELSTRFLDALNYAFEVHREQRRKGSGVPYLAHLLGVAAIVLEEGGSEDHAIAGLLHDAVEDGGGRERLEDIRSRFGEGVASIVWGCTDSLDHHTISWAERKEMYLQHLKGAPEDVLRVALADKIYNARSIVLDQMRVGDAIFTRFKGGKDGTLRYFRDLVAIFAVRLGETVRVAELRKLVEEMRNGTG